MDSLWPAVEVVRRVRVGADPREVLEAAVAAERAFGAIDASPVAVRALRRWFPALEAMIAVEGAASAATAAKYIDQHGLLAGSFPEFGLGSEQTLALTVAVLQRAIDEAAAREVTVRLEGVSRPTGVLVPRR